MMLREIRLSHDGIHTKFQVSSQGPAHSMRNKQLLIILGQRTANGGLLNEVFVNLWKQKVTKRGTMHRHQ